MHNDFFRRRLTRHRTKRERKGERTERVFRREGESEGDPSRSDAEGPSSTKVTLHEEVLPQVEKLRRVPRHFWACRRPISKHSRHTHTHTQLLRFRAVVLEGLQRIDRGGKSFPETLEWRRGGGEARARRSARWWGAWIAQTRASLDTRRRLGQRTRRSTPLSPLNPEASRTPTGVSSSRCGRSCGWTGRSRTG